MEIKPQYKHSKIGQSLFDICAKWTKFIVKHKWLYYTLALTWGIIMTLLGWLILAILEIARLFNLKLKVKKFYWVQSVSVGPEWWGGCEMGLLFFRDWKSGDAYINNHEFGHTFQNCLFGPLFPFLVALPSASRYWYQTIRENKGKTNPPYDAIWFEDAATQCGDYAVWYLSHQYTK